MKYALKFTLSLCLLLLIGFSAGCVPEVFSVPSQQQVNRVKQDVDQFRQTLDKLDTYVKTLPAGSPERRMQEQLIEKIEKGMAVQEAWLKAQESGDTSDLAKLIGELPYVGGWGGFALTLLGYFVQKRRNSTLVEEAKTASAAFEQTTAGIHAVYPDVASIPQALKDALEWEQTPETKALVKAVKAKL